MFSLMSSLFCSFFPPSVPKLQTLAHIPLRPPASACWAPLLCVPKAAVFWELMTVTEGRSLLPRTQAGVLGMSLG